MKTGQVLVLTKNKKLLNTYPDIQIIVHSQIGNEGRHLRHFVDL